MFQPNLLCIILCIFHLCLLSFTLAEDISVSGDKADLGGGGKPKPRRQGAPSSSNLADDADSSTGARQSAAVNENVEDLDLDYNEDAGEGIFKDNWPPKGVRLDGDPALWPGHLRQFGRTGIMRQVEVLTGNTTAQLLINDYIVSHIPVVLKDGAKDFPATKNWRMSDYLLGLPQSYTTWITPQSPGKSTEVDEVTLRVFINTFMKENLYFYAETPSFMRKEIHIPEFLLCEPLIAQLSQSLLWFSGRDNFGWLHQMDTNTLRCVLAGLQEVTLVNPFKFAEKIPINMEEVDASSVNFTQFPTLREVEYDKALLEAGDCMLIPSKWYRQLNSYGRTISVDITFHQDNIEAWTKKQCGDVKRNQNLNNYTFMDQLSADSDTIDVMLHHLITYLDDKSPLKYPNFEAKLKKDKTLLANMTKWTDEFEEITKELFETLDVNADKKFSVRDLESLTPLKLETMRGLLEDRMADYQDIISDQLLENTTLSQAGKLEYVTRYINQLETVLMQSIEQFVATGTMPDLKSKMAAIDARKELIGESTGVQSDSSEYYMSREDAKAKLKAKRDKKEADKKASSSETESVEADDRYVVVDESQVEEIMAEDTDEDSTLPEKPKPSTTKKDEL